MAAGLGEVFQIGTNSEIRIGDLFQLIAKLMGSKAAAVVDAERLRPAGSEVRRLCCDNQKLKAATGFEPSTSLHDGLNTTIAWFQRPENLARYKTHVYND